MRIGPLSGLLGRLQSWTAWAGSRRSAMIVRLFGVRDGRRVERRWTLIADKDDGPEIPSLAVPILLERAAAGRLPPEAMDAGTLLDLEDFAPQFGRLAVIQEIVEIPQPPPLYAQVMGARFAALPKAVRDMHDLLRDGGARGEAEVERGANPLARLVARLAGFPKAGRHNLHVAFAERDGCETWTRDFSGRRFSSRLSEHKGLLVERFGLLRFGFELPSDDEGLDMVLRRWWLGPIPLPMALAPIAPAREWDEEGRFRFDVRIGLRLVGPVVHYRGWLVREDGR
jgi:plasmid stabilization system protein ParE